MIDTVYRDDMIEASSWVWAKDNTWEAKARLVIVKASNPMVSNTLLPRLEVLCTRLGGLHWSPDLSEHGVNTLIIESGINDFLYGKALTKESIEEGIHLVHSTLYSWAGQNYLCRLTKGKEAAFPYARPLPPGMTRISFSAVPAPLGPVGCQGYQGRASSPSRLEVEEGWRSIPRSSSQWKDISKTLEAAGFSDTGGGWKHPKGPIITEAEIKCVPLNELGAYAATRLKGAGKKIATSQKWEVRIPEDYVPQTSVVSWEVEVVENYGDGIILVEHRPDRVCASTIRYTEFEEVMRAGRLL